MIRLSHPPHGLSRQIHLGDQFSQIAITRKSLLQSQMQLADDGVQMRWHVGYYDLHGDRFDVVALANRYKMSRNDLVDLAQINSNLFVSGAGLDKEETKAKQQQRSFLSLASDSEEHSFRMRTVRPGRLVMELEQVTHNRGTLDSMKLMSTFNNKL